MSHHEVWHRCRDWLISRKQSLLGMLGRLLLAALTKRERPVVGSARGREMFSTGTGKTVRLVDAATRGRVRTSRRPGGRSVSSSDVAGLMAIITTTAVWVFFTAWMRTQ